MLQPSRCVIGGFWRRWCSHWSSPPPCTTTWRTGEPGAPNVESRTPDAGRQPVLRRASFYCVLTAVRLKLGLCLLLLDGAFPRRRLVRCGFGWWPAARQPCREDTSNRASSKSNHGVMFVDLDERARPSWAASRGRLSTSFSWVYQRGSRRPPPPPPPRFPPKPPPPKPPSGLGRAR